ncbi:hypothetical protein FPQ18DRAFT_46868 [Pyronema domesticum]|nr:hypothetical protein FPQ18DRAFT_46868 [Pyronema domesticum]
MLFFPQCFLFFVFSFFFFNNHHHTIISLSFFILSKRKKEILPSAFEGIYFTKGYQRRPKDTAGMKSGYKGFISEESEERRTEEGILYHTVGRGSETYCKKGLIPELC